MSKLRSKKGFTLFEVLAAVLVLVFLVVGISTISNVGTGLFTSTAQNSETELLSGILNNAIVDLLRYSDIQVAETTSELSELKITNRNLGISDQKFAVSNGYIVLVDNDGKESMLISEGSYDMLRVKDLIVEYNKDTCSYRIRYSLYNPNRLLSSPVRFDYSVRVANQSDAFFEKTLNDPDPIPATITLYANEGDITPLLIDTSHNVGDSFSSAEYTSYLKPLENSKTEFDGWYTAAGAKFQDDTPIPKNLSLFGRWAEKQMEYEVGYYFKGDTNPLFVVKHKEKTTCVPNTDQSANANVQALKDKQNCEKGYKFSGWYSDPECTKKVSSFSVTDNTKLYSKWEAVTYTITYNYYPKAYKATKNLTAVSTTFTVENGLTVKNIDKTRSYSVSFNPDSNYYKQSVASINGTFAFANWVDTNGNKIIVGRKLSDLVPADSHSSATINLYATWTAAEITMPSLPVQISGESVYYCYQWSDRTNGKYLAPDDKYAPEFDSMKFTGSWKQPTSETSSTTVTMRDDWAKVIPSVKTFNFPKKFPVSLPTAESLGFSKDYYTFAYWRTAKEKIVYANQVITNLNDYEESLNLVIFYGVWIPANYTITYTNLAGANQTSQYTHEAKFNLLSAPSKNGYTFSKWAVQSSTGNWSTGSTYSAGQSFEYGTFKKHGKYGDVVMSAEWNAIEYTATFNPNNGGSTSTDKYTIEGGLTLPTAPTKPGYTFAGWVVESASGNWAKGASATNGNGKYGDVTFVANWSQNKYNAVFTDTNKKKVVSTLEYTVDSGFTFPKTSRGGYSYKWKVVSTSGDANWVIGDKYSNSTASPTGKYGNVNFETVWTASTYTAKFDANGGTVTPASSTYKITGTLTLPTPQRAGYTFSGWLLGTKVGKWEAKTYTAGDYSKQYGNVTFVAQWTPISYTASFAGSDIGTVSPKGYTIESTFSFPGPNSSPANKRFDGWKVSSAVGGWTDTSALYTMGSTSPSGKYGNVTFNAQWTNLYTVTVESNNSAMGSVDKSSITGVPHGSSISSSSNTITINGTTVTATPKTGYKFSSWSVSSGTVTGAMTIKANFELKKYTVTIQSANSAMGSVNVSSISNVPHFTTVSVSGNKLTINGTTVTATANTGYEFVSWSISNGTKISGAVTIKATFKVKTYTVNFSSNGNGTVSPTSLTEIPHFSSVSVNSNGTLTINGKTVTVTPAAHYKFSSWSPSVSSYTGQSEFKASFELQKFKVTVNSSDSSKGTVSGTGTLDAVAYGTVITADGANLKIGGNVVATATPATGYYFKSWSIGSSSTVQGACTITANFEIQKYTVTISSGTGGSVNKTSITNVPYGTAVSVNGSSVTVNGTTATATASSGYEFKSWNVANGATVTGNTTITASFAKLYTITVTEAENTNIYINGVLIPVNSPKYYAEGTTITIYSEYLKDKDRKTIVRYSDKTQSTTERTMELVMPSADVTIVARSKKCFAKGTLITLADGTQKPVEELTGNELIRTWDFFSGSFKNVRISVLNVHAEDYYTEQHLVFDNGTEIGIVGGHGFFDVDKNSFITIDELNYSEYIGDKLSFLDGSDVLSTAVLSDCYFTEGYGNTYSVWAAGGMDCFANNLLTVGPDWKNLGVGMFSISNMKYDENEINSQVKQYGLFDYSEWSDYLTKDQFDAYNTQYFKILVGKGIITKEKMVYYIQNYVLK